MKKQILETRIVRKRRRRGRDSRKGLAEGAWENAPIPVRKEILRQVKGASNESVGIMASRPWSALSLWAKTAVRRWKRHHR